MSVLSQELVRRMGQVWAGARGALVAGGLALAPLGITIWVFVELIDLTDEVIHLLPRQLQPMQLIGFDIPGLGVVLTLIVLILFGMMLKYYIGRRIVEFYEAILRRVPVLSGIYHGLKESAEGHSQGAHA